MRFGIFGGSFDPPHVGHLLAATDAAEQLGLDRLFWVPTAQQPLKTGTPHYALPEQRYAMVAAAVAGHPLFAPSRIEIDRPGLSYTVTTIERFLQEYSGSECSLLVGEDAWTRFSEWREPDRIRTLARVIVLTRFSETQQGGRTGEGAPEQRLCNAPAPPLPSSDRWPQDVPDLRLHTRRVDVSATEIRARVRSGKPIRGFVPDAVAAIIESERLYRW